MTAFPDFEESLEASRPLEIYVFTLGAETFRYTSAEDSLTVATFTYTPMAISRSQISQGSDARNKNLLITIQSVDPFAAKFVNVPPGQKAAVSVFRLQRDEVPTFNTQILLFKGFVQSVSYPQNGHSAEIVVRSIETALNRKIPRFTFMGSCNHVLYDSRCGVNPSLFDHTGNVSAESGAPVGSIITVDGAAATGLDFVGGFCKPTSATDFRAILAQAGNDLTLLLPFATSPLSSNVQVFAGCDRLIGGDCGLVFDNVLEFGGFAFVPNRNPFGSGGLNEG